MTSFWHENLALSEGIYDGQKWVYTKLLTPYQKWTMPIRDWKAALNRFNIQFGERMPRASNLTAVYTKSGTPSSTCSSTMLYAEQMYRHHPKAKADDLACRNEANFILGQILDISWSYSKHQVSDRIFLLQLETTRNLHNIAH